MSEPKYDWAGVPLTYWQTHPHWSKLVEIEASPSGKRQWRCTKCERVTAGAEKECHTFAMMTKEEVDDWLKRIQERIQ